MNITELSKHCKLGIDFDGTLIGHARSAILQQFILDHQGVKEFHIVTHRSHGLQDLIGDELAAHTRLTGVPLGLHHFTAIHAVPNDLYEGHKRFYVKQSDLEAANHVYYGWKALRCQEIGCTVLIDDMAGMIVSHCEAIGIVCLHPDHF